MSTEVAEDTEVTGRLAVANQEDRWLSGPRLRWVYRVVVLVAIAPLFVSAIRNGLAGWEPTWDAATTAVRIRDVFSAHPPLVGMAALPAKGATTAYSFPGALQLYLLAVPVKVLGTTWGLLLGMAAINAAMCATAIWLVRRRLGERWAMVTAGFVTSLLWTLGSQVIVYPTPLLMGILPLFLLLISAWSVADGDAPALVVLAFVGNYLFLDQLKFIVVVPLVGLCALVLWVMYLRRCRRDDRPSWVLLRRRHLRWCGAGIALTALVWLPPLVGQLFYPAGNLGNLVHAFTSGQVDARQYARFAPTTSGALGVVVSVTAVPSLWLPTSFANPPFNTKGGGVSFLVGLVCALALFGLLAWGTVRARRRRDASMVTGVAIGVAGWVAYLTTARLNPDSQGYLPRYFLGLWPLSAYLWLLVVYGLVAGRPPLLRRARAYGRGGFAVIVGSVVVLAALSMPYSDHVSQFVGSKAAGAWGVRHVVARKVAGPGPVLVVTSQFGRRYYPSVLLGLQDAGIPFRVEGVFDSQQFGASRDRRQHPDAVTRIVLNARPSTDPNARLICRAQPPPVISDSQFASYSAKLRRWLASLKELHPIPDRTFTPQVQHFLTALAAQFKKVQAGVDSFMTSKSFLFVLVAWDWKHEGRLFDIPGLTARQTQLWAREMARRQYRSVYVYQLPMK